MVQRRLLTVNLGSGHDLFRFGDASGVNHVDSVKIDQLFFDERLKLPLMTELLTGRQRHIRLLPHHPQGLRIERSDRIFIEEEAVGFHPVRQLDRLDRLLSAEDKQLLAGLMTIDHETWRAAAEPLPDGELLHLIRFFAAAENLPGWEAGANSPVIPLAQILRRRGVRLDRELLQWLREVSDNRFLPYGPL